MTDFASKWRFCWQKALETPLQTGHGGIGSAVHSSPVAQRVQLVGEFAFQV
jgi:hypothetical protein